MRLIDADALIPMIKYATIDNEIGVFPIRIGFNAIVKVINEQPTIEAVPERKKGRWKSDEEEGDIMCSCCGDWWASGFETAFHYCPNCGASMTEGAEDELV